jgi:hypothetical protein
MIVIFAQYIMMAHFEIDGVFYFMAAAALILTFLAAGRSFTTTAPHHLERPFEILAPQSDTAGARSAQGLRRTPVAGPNQGCFRGQLTHAFCMGWRSSPHLTGLPRSRPAMRWLVYSPRRPRLFSVIRCRLDAR